MNKPYKTDDWKVVAKRWHDYDPIGVFIDPDPDNPFSDDQYDNYVQPTLDLLNDGVSKQELLNYVIYIAREYSGMYWIEDGYIEQFVGSLLEWNKKYIKKYKDSSIILLNYSDIQGREQLGKKGTVKLTRDGIFQGETSFF